MSRAELPPRPDPHTGEPFPPPAPDLAEGLNMPEWLGPPHRSRRAPKPPAGRGPALAWHDEHWPGKPADVLASTGVMIVVLLIIALINWTISVFGYWQMWVFVVVCVLLMAQPFRQVRYSCGADWLRISRTQWGVTRHQQVDLYQLRMIDTVITATGPEFSLQDSLGSVLISHAELNRDQRMWALMYNGILHSLAAGGRTYYEVLPLLPDQRRPSPRDNGFPSPEDGATDSRGNADR